MRRSLGADKDQGAEMATFARDRRRRARCVPDRLVNAGEVTVTPGQPHTAAHLRTGRLTRCANRPSKHRVAGQFHDAGPQIIPPPSRTSGARGSTASPAGTGPMPTAR
jgi:hypothetical protein